MTQLAALVGPAVAVIFGGVVGAGAGITLLYAGLLEEGQAENIFEDEASADEKADVKAHSVYEAPKQSAVKAASPYEGKRVFGRGFAAMFS